MCLFYFVNRLVRYKGSGCVSYPLMRGETCLGLCIAGCASLFFCLEMLWTVDNCIHVLVGVSMLVEVERAQHGIFVSS